MESILNSIKKLLGLNEEQTDFDTDIIIHINSVFSILNQIGVGPEDGFRIEDESLVWEDFIQDNKKLNDVKTFMYLKVKMMFDPPLSSAVIKAYEGIIDELTFRLNVTAESKEAVVEEE